MAITSNVARWSAEVEGARTLIELHGDRLWLESREGAGCTFHFTVPLPESE